MDPLTIGLAAGGGLLSGLGSLLGGFGASSRARRARQAMKRAWKYSEAERRAFEERLAPIERFYEQYFQGPPAWLQDVMRSNIRAAQEARGIAYGAMPAAWEGMALSALTQRGLEQAAAALPALYMLPYEVQQRTWAMAAGKAQALASAQGPSALEILGRTVGNVISGAGGGFLLGQQLAPQVGQTAQQLPGLNWLQALFPSPAALAAGPIGLTAQYGASSARALSSLLR